MVNTRNKGRRIELEARKILESEGYIVEKKNASRWQSDDFFGLFDLLAIGKEVRLIQIKSDPSDFYKARRKIGLWRDKVKLNKCVITEVWLRETRKPFRISVVK